LNVKLKLEILLRYNFQKFKVQTIDKHFPQAAFQRFNRRYRFPITKKLRFF